MAPPLINSKWDWYRDQGIKVPLQEFGVRDGTSPNYKIGTKSLSAKRTIKIGKADKNWDMALLAAIQAVGWSCPEIGSPVGLHRHVPEFMPGVQPLVCVDVDVSGIAWKGVETINAGGFGPKKQNRFKLGQLALQYSGVNYSIASDYEVQLIADANTAFVGGAREVLRYTSATWRDSLDAYSLPLGSMMWAERGDIEPGQQPGNSYLPPGAKVPLPLPVKHPTTTYTWTWHQVPLRCAPIARAREMQGCVNDKAGALGAAPGFLGAAPGSLYLESAVASEKYPMLQTRLTGSGWEIAYEWAVDMVYTVTHDRVGHNCWPDFYNPAGLGWYQANKRPFSPTGSTRYWPPGQIAKGVCVYDEVDFRDLFKPVTPSTDPPTI